MCFISHRMNVSVTEKQQLDVYLQQLDVYLQQQIHFEGQADLKWLPQPTDLKIIKKIKKRLKFNHFYRY